MGNILNAFLIMAAMIIGVAIGTHLEKLTIRLMKQASSGWRKLYIYLIMVFVMGIGIIAIYTYLAILNAPGR